MTATDLRVEAWTAIRALKNVKSYVDSIITLAADGLRHNQTINMIHMQLNEALREADCVLRRLDDEFERMGGEEAKGEDA